MAMFFEPPVIVETSVFTEMPARFRKAPGTVARHGRPESRDSFLEGPAFDRDGNLYVVDIPWGRIFRISPGGEWTLLADYEGQPNGLALHRDGRLFVADRQNGLVVVDPATGRVETHLAGPPGERFHGLNDLVFAANGDLYFTDQGHSGLQDPHGRVWRLAADGTLACVIQGLPSPNGIALNARDSTLFVAVTRANAVWIAPAAGGSRVGLFVQLPSPGPDGLATDAAGNLCVAHPGAGLVWIYDRRGVPTHQVVSRRGHMTTNIAFGGADGRTLHVVESRSGSVLTARLEHPGRPLYSHAPAGKDCTGAPATANADAVGTRSRRV